jgi:hypothetical protein
MFTKVKKGMEKVEDALYTKPLLCLDKKDVFGDSYDWSVYGSYALDVYRLLTIMYRPCIPIQRTNFTANMKCVVDDVTNKTQMA